MCIRDRFSAVFDFYPVLVDYSGIMSEMNGGGGTFGLPELKPDEGVKATYYHAFTADELDAIVRGNGCTVLYIQMCIRDRCCWRAII